MADQIEVELVGNDSQFVSSTNKAAAAVAALAAQEERLGKASASMGVDQKKFSQQFAKVEAGRIADERKAQQAKDTAEKQASKAAAQLAKKNAADVAKAEKQAARDAEKAEDTRKSKSQQLARVLLGRKALILGEASGIGKAGVAAVELGGAFIAATTAAEALLLAVGKLAYDTSGAKRNAKEFLDVLTAGRGGEALSLIDGLATQLGVKLQTAREQFEQFRQAGLDNKQSANLIKLAADLNSVDRSGELAKQAIERVLSYASNGPQTADQAAAASKAMALLAKQAGVAGDGTNAAADAVTTLAGALGRIDNNKTKALEQIGEGIQPSLDKAGQAMAHLSDVLLNSKEGQKILESIVVAIDKIADAATAAAPKVEALIKDGTIQKGVDGLGAIKDAVGEVGSALFEIPKAFYIVASNINDAVNVIGESMEDVAGTIYKGIASLVPKAEQLGSDVVHGLVNGIKGAASAAYDAVSGLAGDIAEAFAKKLHIHSPSKVFEGFGVNTGEGYERGVVRSMPTGDEIAERATPRSMPTGDEIAERATPRASAFSGGQSPIFGSTRASGTVVHVTVENITVPAGEDAGKWMRAAGHEFGLSIQAVLLSQGAPQ